MSTSTNKHISVPAKPLSPAPGILQRKCACGNHTVGGGECSQCSKNKRTLQRSTRNSEPETRNTPVVPSIVNEVLRSQGQPLDNDTRAFMEPRFGQDFSHVRVHTGEVAAKSADAVEALAYTVGQNVVFGQGQYAPETFAGKKLLGHELAHVVQQAGVVQPKLVVGEAGDQHEREADRAAEGLVQPEHEFTPEGVMPAKQVSAGVGAGNRIQRQAKAKKNDQESKDGPLEKRVGQLEKEQQRQQNKTKALFLFETFTHQVLERATGWQMAAKRVGAAYALAASNHEKALGERAKKEALQTQFMFSVLTVASSGALAWLSGAWLVGREVTLLREALEDATQAAIGETFSAVIPMVKTSDADPENMEPAVFAFKAEARVLAAIQAAHGYFADLSAEMLYASDKTWDAYSEKTQAAKYNEWVNKADLLSGDDSLPSLEVMADELERGMWSKWVVLHLSETRLPMAKEAYQKVTYYKSPGSDLEARFDRLGITKASGVGDFGPWTSDSEIKKVIDWGTTYNVKKFI